MGASYSYDVPSNMVGAFPTESIIGCTAASMLFHTMVYKFAPTGPFKAPAKVAPANADGNTQDKEAAKKALLKEERTIRSYCLSTVHATVISTAVMIWLFVYGWDWYNPLRTFAGGQKGTGDEWQSYGLCFTLGYFIVDSIVMATHKHLASVGGFVHHIAIGTAFVFGLTHNMARPYHFVFCGIEELSTPPLNLKSLFRHKPKLNLFFSLAFAASFWVIRIFLAAYFIWTSVAPTFIWTLQNPHYDTLLKAISVFQISMFSTSRCLNVYWAILIAAKVKASLMGSEGKKAKKTA